MAVPKGKVQKLKYLRIKETDGTIYGDIPLAIDAENVTMENKKDLQKTIGDINHETQGDITTNLRKIKGDIVNINNTIEGMSNTVDYNLLENKPKIESHVLTGDQTFEDLGMSAISNSSIDFICL